MSGLDAAVQVLRHFFEDSAVPIRLRHAWRTKGIKDAETQFVRRDGMLFVSLMISVVIGYPQRVAVDCHGGGITDVTAPKRAKHEIRQLNVSLERPVAACTAGLAASEERLRTLVWHAPEAIVLFDGVAGRFLTA